MLTNEQMKANRFLVWHKARKQYASIMQALKAGKRIMTASTTRPVIYDARHVDMFRCGKTACYVRRGRNNWDSLEFTKLKVID